MLNLDKVNIFWDYFDFIQTLIKQKTQKYPDKLKI